MFKRYISIPIKNMPKNEVYESSGSSEENSVSVIIKKNIETTQVLSWLQLKTNPKFPDWGKLIMMKLKGLSKN